MKKIKYLLIILLLVFFTGCNSTGKETKYTIVTTNFPGYDFVRAIIKDVDDISVKMLISPGSEIHSYEPTPEDIINIQKADLFVYVGGESDEWVDNLIDNIDPNKTRVVKLMDFVNNVYEEKVNEISEDEDEKELDEHVWTSPKNAITIVQSLSKEIIEIDEINKDKYITNENKYVEEITAIDNEIQEVVNTAKRKELIFGDRFPFRYFTDLYGLKYYAAFPGCSSETEANAKTIAYLIDKVKNDNIPVILKIELSSGKVSEAIQKETGAKILELHSAHNISQDDFDKGITYVDIMKKNIEVLKIALN
jgi:zinc transport system substrate-binding protein